MTEAETNNNKEIKMETTRTKEQLLTGAKELKDLKDFAQTAAVLVAKGKMTHSEVQKIMFTLSENLIGLYYHTVSPQEKFKYRFLVDGDSLLNRINELKGTTEFCE